MFSDNGTNFVGAEKEIVSDVKKFTHESFVRSTKLALYRMLRAEQLASNHPTEEILRTLLFEVAGLLNSRPLTYVSSDVKDLQALTPNDLIGRTTTTDIASRPCHDALPSERYRYVQRLTNLFWQMWMKNYLPSLVARKKWHTKERNFQIGDRVIIYDANVPRWIKDRGDLRSSSGEGRQCSCRRCSHRNRWLSTPDPPSFSHRRELDSRLVRRRGGCCGEKRRQRPSRHNLNFVFLHLFLDWSLIDREVSSSVKSIGALSPNRFERTSTCTISFVQSPLCGFRVPSRHFHQSAACVQIQRHFTVKSDYSTSVNSYNALISSRTESGKYDLKIES